MPSEPGTPDALAHPPRLPAGPYSPKQALESTGGGVARLPRCHPAFFSSVEIRPEPSALLATPESGCYAPSGCPGGIFYSRGLKAPSAAGAARRRAPPTLPAPERGWVAVPGSLSGFTKRRNESALTP